MEEKLKQTGYLDALRILATFCVVMIHVSAQNWYIIDVTSADWQVLNVYDSLVRWAVPAFLMISGVLFIPRDIEVSVIVKKYCLRLLVAYLGWSFLYMVFSQGIKAAVLGFFQSGMEKQFATLIDGPYHLWYLPMIAGIYLCIPFFQALVQREKLCRYFLLLWGIFSIALPTALTILKSLGGYKLSVIAAAISEELDMMVIGSAIGYAGFFVLGYVLHQREMSQKERKLLIFGGILGAVCTILLTAFGSIRQGTPCDGFYSPFALGVAMETVGAFVLFKQMNLGKKRGGKVLHVISKACFGAFLVHLCVFDKACTLLQMNTLTYTPILMVPIMGLGVFLISLFISLLLQRIPFINRYFV